MPDFGTPFNGNNLDREKKLSKDEMIRALRFTIAAEFEAIQMYEQLANASSDSLFRKVMRDIAKEEEVHAGEFMRVLFNLKPDEQENYHEGFKEVEKIIKNPSKI